MIELIVNKQEYLLYLPGIMVSTWIIKKYNYFSSVYTYVVNKIKSKKSLVVILSAISGILPIPGRVSVSAGLLDTIAPKKASSRAKFGIIDYLATHHYYLWSPLEKTIIIPMAVLGFTYLETLIHLLPLLIVSIGYIGYYLYYNIEERDVKISITKNKDSNMTFTLMPLIMAIGLLICGIKGWIVFPILSIYYILYARDFNVLKYINWTLLTTVFVIIVFSNIFAAHYSNFKETLSGTNSLAVALFFGFASSFLLGSSGKFIGITALLTQIFGAGYFVVFFALEYAAYLISPTHKCTSIGRAYFNTPFNEYYRVIGVWALLVVVCGMVFLIV